MKAPAIGVLALGLWLGAAHAQPPSPETLSSPLPRGTLDPRAPLQPLEDALRQMRDDRLAAPVLERYEAQEYGATATLGLPLLERAPGQHALRLAVANSLAWTGRYDEAAAQYRRLFGTPYDAQARVGFANVLRWRGQAHLAEPYYQEVLAREPGNRDAAEGFALAGRELRPALTVRAARTDDRELARDEFSVAYRRWSADRRLRFEAGILAGHSDSALGDWSPRSLFASAWSPSLPLSPQIDLAYYDSGVRSARLFATAQIEPVHDALKLRAGRVDWGRTAFSAGATADALTANLFGMATQMGTQLGSLSGRLDLYDISDGNKVLDGEARLTPAWQPLPWRLTWFGGVYGRDADREDPRYWSPRPTYFIAFAGVQRNWSLERSDLTASIRRGFALSSSAGDSWAGGMDGRYWLRPDFALGVEGWVVDAPRPGRYRVHHVGVFVQQLL